MTRRSVFLGLLGAITVCTITYFNDWVLRQTHFVGNNMPVSIYGGLVIFVLFLNVMLRKWALDGRELAVILALTLSACCIPGSGLLRTFPGSLILPYHHNRLEPAWREHKVIDAVPKHMLVDLSRDENRVLDGYVQGLSEGGKHLSVGEVPWHAWWRPWVFWLPTILAMLLALIGLSLVVHKQWAHHEHLPYPIAAFTEALLETDEKGRSSLWRNRLFWIGASIVFLIHLNNFMSLWFPRVMIPIALRLNLGGLGRLFPFITRGGGWYIFYPRIFFAVIGVSFFIATELAAAFGLGPCLWALVAGGFATYGISLNSSVLGGAHIGLQPRVFLLFGACLGIFISLLYTGRHYYWAVVRGALGLSHGEDVDGLGIWGARLFVLLFGVFVLLLAHAGIDWQLGFLYGAILIVAYTVSARLMAEGGLFHIKVNVFPCAMIWGIFGSAALGYHQLLLLQMVTMVLFIDPRETLLPFLVNANKLLDTRRIHLGKTCSLAALAIVLGLGAALPITLFIQYDVPAATQGDRWAFSFVPKMPFDNAVATKQKLESQGVLEEAEARSGWERFGAMRPVGICLWGFVAGLALVVLCSACRMRFPWWPIHPLIFVVWVKSHIGLFAFSFILGWLVKLGVMKYGGSRLYNRLKPLMLGLIAGEILGAMVPSLVGTVYYFVTGKQPISYILYMG